MDVQSIAEQLEEARRNIKPISPITSGQQDFTLSEGYLVQQQKKKLALANGAQLAGYKMGLTSFAKQRDVGVHEPIRGFLLDEMDFGGKAEIPLSQFIHPRVEVEVAVTMKKSLQGAVSLSQVVESIDQMVLAIEILDSRFTGFKFKLPDVVSDNASAAGYVLGKVNRLDHLEEIPLAGVLLKINGNVLQGGAPAAVLGHPLKSVQELCRMLSENDEGLEPGMVVLTGGITASVPIIGGDTVEAQWPGETLKFVGV